MRIQHNIPAMSAYRNYTNNTSALSKNLEKLSSGYKINRAGDDAAGLAISEKMRAQITGLEVAQKNAKDGISLIQTAEGALTEVHSMLNRMYELAEQSANGTYDNDVDRTQLQKEVNQLRSEINRISEASNFNGIKLLDGSMNASDVTTTTPAQDSIQVPILDDIAKNAFTDVGTTTVLKESPTLAAKTEITVNLQNVAIQNAEVGQNVTMTIGKGTDAETTLSLKIVKDDVTAGTGEIRASDATKTDELAKAFEALFKDETNGAGKKIDGQEFETNVSGNQIVFTQKAEPTKESEIVDAALTVEVTYGAGAVTKTDDPPVEDTKYTATTSDWSNGGTAGELNPTGIDVSSVSADLGAATTTATEMTITLNWDNTAKKFNATINGGSYTNQTATATTTKSSDTDGAVTVTVDDGTEFVIKGATDKQWTASNNTIKFKLTSKADEGGGNGGNTSGTNSEDKGINSWNVSTTNNKQGAMNDSGQLASTQITLKDTFATDGGALRIGQSTYLFAVGDDSEVKAKNGETLVKITNNDLAAAGGDIIDAIGIALSQQTNSAFTLGYDKGSNQVSIHETVDQTIYVKDELKTKAGFQELIGASRQASTKTIKGSGTSLVLQIGDTSEDFNKLVVDVKACNAEAMGIGAIDISTQEGASAAMVAIKNAINYVSDVRGDLGATQNRLDHTINNLSVMQENIQDAESTIRDVDVAKEMMDYTKNNILVQSAQAMLAQANQLPQGVLQLLQ